MENIFDFELNNIDRLFTKESCKKFKKLNAEIRYGKFLENIGIAVKKLAPNGVVCFISLIDTFNRFGQNILSAISVKNINVILNKKSDNTIENISGLFNLTEDIRAIVLIDKELLSVARYFSGLRNIPIIFAPSSCDFFNVLNEKVNIRMKGNVETANFDNYKYIILDKDLLEMSSKKAVGNAFADIISKQIAILDYTARCIMLKEKSNAKITQSIFQVVKDTMNILDVKDKKLRLSENLLRIEIINYITKGEVFNNSAEGYVATFLSFKGKKNLSVSVCKLFSLKILLKLYQLFFSTDMRIILRTPCFFERSEIFSKKTGASEKVVLDSLIKNSFSFEVINKTIMPYKQEFLKIIENLLIKNKNSMIIYETLTDSYNIESNFTEDDIKEALFSAPDFKNTINLLTLIRDVGILEYLYD